MAKNAEATLLLKIKEQGAAALKTVGDNLEGIRNKAAVASAAMTTFMGLAVKKYGEQEEAVNLLNKSLANQGFEVESLSKHYRDLAQSIQDKTTQDDDAIVKGIALAQTFAGQLKLTDELIKSTVDFAAATGQDLESAFTMVGKSIGTNTNALARNGIELAENATASQKMEKITLVLAKRYDGLAEAQRKGLGELKGFANTMDDFLAEIGKVYAPTLVKMTKETGNFFKMVGQNESLVEWIAGIVAGGAALTALIAGIAAFGLAWPGLVTGLGVIATAASAAWVAITGPIGIAVALTSAAGAAAYFSGALDGTIAKVKELAGIKGSDNPINDGGAQEDERFLRAQSRAKQIADIEIAEANRVKLARIEAEEKIAAERKQLYDAAAKQSIQDQQSEWEKIKGLKEDDDEKKKKEEQENKDMWIGVGMNIATGFVSSVREGDVQQFGSIVAGEVGNVVGNAMNKAFSTESFAGMGGFFKELFLFTSQDPEIIQAQIKAFVDAIGDSDLLRNLGDSGPAIAEGFIRAIADGDTGGEIVKQMARSPAMEWFARQWGMKSGKEYLQALTDGMNDIFGPIWEGISNIVEGGREFINNLFGSIGEFFSRFGEILSSAGSSIYNWIVSAGDGFVSKIGDKFAELANSFGAALSNMWTGLGNVLSNAFNNFIDKFKDTFKAPSEYFQNFLSGISNAMSGFKDSFTSVFEDLKKSLTDPIQSVKDTFNDFINAIKSLFGGGDNGSDNPVGNALAGLGKKLGLADGGLVPGFARGGMVSGTIQRLAAGGTTDTVPAMLTPGEFVINRDATQKNLRQLEAINSGVGGGGGGSTINITISGGLLGDEQSARQLAKAIDEQLLKLRQGNQSLSFDSGIF